MTLSREHCQQLDTEDSLQTLREHFVLPAGEIYLDGNSLGCMPKAAADEVNQTVQQEWSKDLITSWNKAGWFDLPTQYGDTLAPLIGADQGEVIVSDSTSLNIFKAIFAGLSLRPDRTGIVAESAVFLLIYIWWRVRLQRALT